MLDELSKISDHSFSLKEHILLFKFHLRYLLVCLFYIIIVFEKFIKKGIK
jgi:hypothetical protein